MYEGIITPIVTPFNRDNKQKINYNATEQLINHLINKGVTGIFILGSNGEFHVLSHTEKIEFAKRVVKIVDSRVPVFAGTGACYTGEVVTLSKEMEDIGVDALSIVTPYFIQPSNEEILNYYETIAKNVKIPIILYNIPKNTGCNIAPNTVESLSQIDNICGIKDSSGDMDNLKSYIEAAKDQNFDVLVGSDSKIIDGYKMGATGAIAGTSGSIIYDVGEKSLASFFVSENRKQVSSPVE
ncbi:dihydrodipicolinate synthase family protein [Tetragenococcus koreensis]|uniref:dihydrodipicolinate synthase family protein n=1 Tax=Tetragenococcus koreensis TaxID=290335 RepID=UPI001F3E2215|nr:dihydrodipicolinate synthase family protein [Tetragenococcus koreensis]MCF1618139.1 dihydrodipicolinate synthase family protein [Tetragenococcus koreensis]MCF1623004.1 dihydrodipicolinate synthase family protein [Tetragenococcus koreensis]MCF1678980.1 dihydrodipicolinate synthase family protein [Tetragenococcus koreensis]MCF1683732.1 dihydrodipicolinate synthase family protein [Tetragenococcus koreensis]MCF1688414.1 dihydrodipicolinate synthase family protein [Tetragenococcus koreensis]